MCCDKPQHIIFSKKYCVADMAHNTIFFEKETTCCDKLATTQCFFLNNVLWQKK